MGENSSFTHDAKFLDAFDFGDSLTDSFELLHNFAFQLSVEPTAKHSWTGMDNKGWCLVQFDWLVPSMRL